MYVQLYYTNKKPFKLTGKSVKVNNHPSNDFISISVSKEGVRKIDGRVTAFATDRIEVEKQDLIGYVIKRQVGKERHLEMVGFSDRFHTEVKVG